MRGKDTLILIAGNKLDCKEQRQVTKEDADKLASELGVCLFETSAKEGINVKPLFQKLVTSLPGLENTDIAIASDGIII